jgi:hypothetical protein
MFLLKGVNINNKSGDFGDYNEYIFYAARFAA